PPPSPPCPYTTLFRSQRFGRSLMLPIAALPAAGILLRLGQDDLLGGWGPTEEIGQVLAAAGGSLFDWLPLLFAVGIAVGFARKGDRKSTRLNSSHVSI